MTEKYRRTTTIERQLVENTEHKL